MGGPPGPWAGPPADRSAGFDEAILSGRTIALQEPDPDVTPRRRALRGRAGGGALGGSRRSPEYGHSVAFAVRALRIVPDPGQGTALREKRHGA